MRSSFNAEARTRYAVWLGVCSWMWGPRALMQPREHRCCRMFSKRRRRNAKGSCSERNPQWFCSLARTAKTPARSGAKCGVKAISAIGCAAQLAEQHKPRARARTHRGRTRAQWPQHPGPSSPRKSRVCDCSHTQCSNTRPRAGRTLAERRPNAARCHDFARADSARASRARQRRARQRRARQ